MLPGQTLSLLSLSALIFKKNVAHLKEENKYVAPADTPPPLYTPPSPHGATPLSVLCMDLGAVGVWLCWYGHQSETVIEPLRLSGAVIYEGMLNMHKHNHASSHFVEVAL